MTKLLYVLPEYVSGAHTHFSYIPLLLERVATSLDIMLVVEKGQRPDIAGVKRIANCISMPFAKFFHLTFHILRARIMGYRVCYVHYSFGAAFIASIIFRLSGGRVLYWNCGLPWLYTRSFVRDAFERVVYKIVSDVVTGTERLAEKYAEVYGIPIMKVRVMPNWIDVKKVSGEQLAVGKEETRDEIGIKNNHKMVLFAHRLSERKGAQYLPDIARRLPNDTVLVVVGDGPLKNGLMLRAKNDEALKKRFIFVGWLPHDKVLQYMAASNLFIMPSDEEGFPHVLLEAMALSVPFVATDVGGVAEIVPPGVRSALVPKGDIKRFSEEISKVLTSSAYMNDDGKQETRRWVEKYDIGPVSERFIHLVTDTT
jgi:glycosyltransferase involved in cell wall biosynthesis